jgi:hypothetical protein
MAGDKNPSSETVESLRRRETIQKIQQEVARELRSELEAPEDLPRRLADLARELHRRLRKAEQLRSGFGYKQPQQGLHWSCGAALAQALHLGIAR